MRVRNAFIPPTALRMLKSVAGIRRRFRLDLRIDRLGRRVARARDLRMGARRRSACTVNEFYGQTECNLVLGSCARASASAAPARSARPCPATAWRSSTPRAGRCRPGEVGQIAVARPDPVMFLEYWQNPEATAKKFIGDWMTTGDQGVEDDDGYVQFFGRDDDVITSAGLPHRSGRDRGLPDRPSGDRARRRGRQAGPAAHRDRQGLCRAEGRRRGQPTRLPPRSAQWVRERLSAHEYPREVEFVDSMPLTTTGKVIRRIFRDRARREAGLSALSPALEQAAHPVAQQPGHVARLLVEMELRGGLARVMRSAPGVMPITSVPMRSALGPQPATSPGGRAPRRNRSASMLGSSRCCLRHLDHQQRTRAKRPRSLSS